MDNENVFLISGLFLGLGFLAPHQGREQFIHRRRSYQNIDSILDYGPGTEQARHQIQLKKTHQSPIETADHNKQQ